VVTLPALLRRVARLRRGRPRPRIVLANGLFDLLHVGHLRYLRAASSLGDYLVVAVNDDRSARRLRGAARPVASALDRSRLVAAVDGVDAVVLFSGRTASGVLARLRPDIHCKGTDYTPSTVPEAALVRSWAGQVRIVGDPKRHASSDLIARIARRCGRRAVRSPRSFRARTGS
jgi:rfaE bifunctional protein nucleotidyltransferase chain/domain